MTSALPSQAQLAVARDLVRERQRLTARVEYLGDLIRRRHSLAESDGRSFNDRLKFKFQEHLLAGLAEFCQRQHPVHHRRVIMAYQFFLEAMIDPPTPFTRLDEPALPKPPPHRVDFAALSRAARPYLLGPYLDLHQGNRFPEIDLLRSRPSHGHVVLVQPGGPVEADLWRRHLPAITAWLEGEPAQGTWTLTHHAASTLTLTRQPALPASLPHARAHLAPGALFVGIDVVQRTPLHIPFADLTAGTYIPGASGSGKTSALHVLLRSIFANLDHFAAVYLVDGKDGVAMSRYARLHPKIRVLHDEPDVWRLAADLTALMRERNIAQRAQGTDKATRDFIAVVIDELPTFVAEPVKEQKKEHEAFLDNLQRIAMRGRSAGIRMFLISQAPVKEQIPVTLRTNCATTIAFRLPEQAHATSIFGQLDAANDPRKLPTGQAVVWQSDVGRITRVQFPFAPLYQPGRPL